MGIALRSGLSFCTVGAFHIFLDLLADRYFSLGPIVAASFSDLLAGKPLDANGRAALQPLFSANLLVPTDEPGRPRACVAEPFVSALPACHPGGRVSGWGLTRALLDLRWSRHALAVRPLAHVLDDVARDVARNRRDIRDDDAIIVRASAAFRACGILATDHDRCLANSLAMSRFLLRSGVRSRIVFGVKVRPFAAHCWLEHDRVLLNDDPDHAALYTPVLVR